MKKEELEKEIVDLKIKLINLSVLNYNEIKCTDFSYALSDAIRSLDNLRCEMQLDKDFIVGKVFVELTPEQKLMIHEC